MNKLVLPVIVLALLGGGIAWYLFSKSGDSEFELDKEKQQFIWDAEHVTFEIENYFGKPLNKALKENDDEAIRKLVRDDFEAQTLVIPGSTKTNLDTFVEEKWTEDLQTESTDVNGLIAFFRERMKGYAEVLRAKTRVIKIHQAAGEPGSWDTELLITVHGVSQSGNPLKIRSHHLVRFQYEEDEQIHDGNAAKSWKTVDISLTESTKPFFAEKTTQLGLHKFNIPDNWVLPVEDTHQFLFQIAVEDFDLDGDYDIAVSTYDGIPYLLAWENGKYVNKSQALGLKSWEPIGARKSALAGWIDFDNDGYPDLIMGKYIYKNVGGLRFRDITEESGFNTGHDPHGITVADYDCDGLLDLYVSYPRGYQQKLEKAGWVGDEEGGVPNKLWHNEGNGKFKDVTSKANAGGGARTTFTSSWFFYDDDAYPDLYVVNDFAQNIVLRNKGDGTFEDISAASGAADFATSMGLATGDLDNDGTTEIYVANMFSKMGRRIISHVSDEDYPEGIYPQIQGSCAGNRLYRMSSNGGYEDVTDIAGVNEVGWAFAPLMCDFDGDGLLDIYATTGFMSFDRKKPDG